jgi:hypothetical protein
MNVQPTFLARVVAPYAEPGIGTIVTVVRVAAAHEQFGPDSYNCAATPSWVVQGWVRNESGRTFGPLLCIADECLRPIDANATPNTQATTSEVHS